MQAVEKLPPNTNDLHACLCVCPHLSRKRLFVLHTLCAQDAICLQLNPLHGTVGRSDGTKNPDATRLTGSETALLEGTAANIK